MNRNHILIAAAVILVLPVVALAGVVAFGTAKPPPPMPSVDGKAGAAANSQPLPPLSHLASRDGTAIAYRVYRPAARAAGAPVAILIHGSAGSSANMNVLGRALAQQGIAAYAPDVRGHGDTGKRGDIAYIGQLEDDLADLAAVAKRDYPDAPLVLAGHSSGGGFVLRAAGAPVGKQFSRFVLLAPFLGAYAPSTRPAAGGWTSIYMPRVIGLTILNHLGVTAFNGLPVLAFAQEPGQPVRTWSYRLMSNFGIRDQASLTGDAYIADAAKASGRMVLFAGSKDESMIADHYGEAFAKLKPAMPITVIPGVGHMDLLSDPRAVPAVEAAIAGKPTAPVASPART